MAKTQAEVKPRSKHEAHQFGNLIRFLEGGAFCLANNEGQTLTSFDIYKQLAADFAEDVIERTSDSQTRKGYDTTGVKYQAVVDRFNDVLTPWGWGYDVLSENFGEFKTASNRIMVDCDVTVMITVGGQAVGLPVTSKSHVGNHRAATRGDARKGAITNALKKCAAMFGNGRKVYLGTLDDDDTIPDESQAAVAGKAKAAPATKSEAKTEALPADWKPTQADLESVCQIGNTTKGKRFIDIDTGSLKLMVGYKKDPKVAAIAKAVLEHREHQSKADEVKSRLAQIVEFKAKFGDKKFNKIQEDFRKLHNIGERVLSNAEADEFIKKLKEVDDGLPI